MVAGVMGTVKYQKGQKSILYLFKRQAGVSKMFTQKIEGKQENSAADGIKKFDCLTLH